MEEKTVTINLGDAERRLKELMAELGHGGKSYKIGINIWHQGGGREVEFCISAFQDTGNCTSVLGASFDDALAQLRSRWTKEPIELKEKDIVVELPGAMEAAAAEAGAQPACSKDPACQFGEGHVGECRLPFPF